MRLKDFKEMINRTVFCASSGIISPRSARWKGGEVLLEKSGGKLAMAAVNNNCKLGFVSRDAEDDFPDFDRVVVPPEVLQKIAGRKRDTVPLSVSVSGNEVNFHIGSACVAATALPGEFVKFPRAPEEFPRLFPQSFTVDRVSLLELLGIVSAAVKLWKPAVNIDLSPGKLASFTGDDDFSAEAEIPCGYSGEETPLTFNAKFLTEIIGHIDTERVTIRFDVNNATVLVLPEPERGYFYFLAQRKRG